MVDTAQPAPTTASSDRLRDFAERYKRLLSRPNQYNPNNVNYRTLTPQDLASLPFEFDNAIVLGLQAAAEERYDVIDDIKPTEMSRIEFVRTLLREAQRRHILGAVLNTTGYIPFAHVDQNVTVTRPLPGPDITPEMQRRATGNALDIAFRDVFTDMLKHPLQTNFVLDPIIADQVGLPRGRTNVISLPNDMQALIVGYIAGADPKNYPENHPTLAAGPLPLVISFDTTPSETLRAFCAGANDIANTGRHVDQTVAADTGFIMGRIDANGRFENTDVPLNSGAGTCTVNPPAWNSSMRIAMAAHTGGPSLRR